MKQSTHSLTGVVQRQLIPLRDVEGVNQRHNVACKAKGGVGEQGWG